MSSMKIAAQLLNDTSCVQKMMKLLRMRGMNTTYEVGATVGMTYFVFYITNGPLQLSGPIAVVVWGLYGMRFLCIGCSQQTNSDPTTWNCLPQQIFQSLHVC
jgi:hypothetical protein